MKILLLCESSHSANYNIAMKIADELNNNNTVFIGYYLTAPEDRTVFRGKYEDEFFIQDGTFDIEYPEIRRKRGLLRYKYLLNHPDLFLSLLVSRFGVRTYTGCLSSAKKLDRYCEEKGINAVIGIAFPYENLIIISQMHYMCLKFGIQLDPQTYNYYISENDRRSMLRLEKRVFKKLDRLFTTDLIKKDLIKSKEFYRARDRIIEIEFPLIEKSDKKSDMNYQIINKKDGEISFLHAGSFYSEIRNPDKLIKLFEMLPDNYVLYVAGNNSEDIREYDEGIRNRVINLGHLSLEEASQARNDADFIICFNNKIANQVPSKLFECINEGKPFINLCQIRNCPTLHYVDGYSMAYSIFTDDYESSIPELIEFVNRKKGTKAERADILFRFGKCTVEYLCGQINNASSGQIER